MESVTRITKSSKINPIKPRPNERQSIYDKELDYKIATEDFIRQAKGVDASVLYSRRKALTESNRRLLVLDAVLHDKEDPISRYDSNEHRVFLENWIGAFRTKIPYERWFIDYHFVAPVIQSEAIKYVRSLEDKLYKQGRISFNPKNND